jgi:integration host factor subunit alpha
MARTKNHIIEILQSELDLTKNQSTDIVEFLLEIVKPEFESGKDVLISGFGKFCDKSRNERKGRNPATGDDLMLTPRKVVTFKCSGKLKERLNGNN